MSYQFKKNPVTHPVMTRANNLQIRHFLSLNGMMRSYSQGRTQPSGGGGGAGLQLPILQTLCFKLDKSRNISLHLK